MVLAALTALGLVVAAVQFVAVLRGSADADDVAASALAATEADEASLDRLRDDLADADAELRDALAAAAGERRDLHGRVADRDDLTDQLTAVRAQLGQLHAAISGTEVETQARAALVTALGTCLDGVTELLNQVSVGDGAGAARTVSAIGPACAAVGTVLG
jgi:hypothetical protein